MQMKKEIELDEIETEKLRAELKRVQENRKLLLAIKEITMLMCFVMAISLILSTLCFPLVKVQTDSMEPTYEIGDILLCIRTKRIEEDDVIIFYSGNKCQISRVIGLPGSDISIDAKGNIYSDSNKTSYGNKETILADQEYPLFIKEKEYFVLNDRRNMLNDSRSKQFGLVKEDDIFALVLFKIWPLK